MIVPAVRREERLLARIAGMNWLERVANVARRAGIERLAVCVSDPSIGGRFSIPGGIDAVFLSGPAELASCSTGRLVIMSPDVLPDVRFLKGLVDMPDTGHAALPEENLDILAVNGSLPVSSLPAFFMDEPMSHVREIVKNDFFADIVSVGQGEVMSVPANDLSSVEKALFRALVKDGEGFMSRYFERKISLAISGRLVETSVTPNQMTIFSVFTGLAGALCIAAGGVAMQSAGALLFLAHSILDGCDGEIARIRFMESRLGGILDFWGDNVVHAAVFSAIGYAWYEESHGMLPLFLAFLAVSGTFLSAGMVYVKTMMKKGDEEGPLYTSVSGEEQPSPVVRIADYLSRRDFIYLVVILAFTGHLQWFLVMAAIGSPGFFLLLLMVNQ